MQYINLYKIAKQLNLKFIFETDHKNKVLLLAHDEQWWMDCFYFAS